MFIACKLTSYFIITECDSGQIRIPDGNGYDHESCTGTCADQNPTCVRILMIVEKGTAEVCRCPPDHVYVSNEEKICIPKDTCQCMYLIIRIV